VRAAHSCLLLLLVQPGKDYMCATVNTEAFKRALTGMHHNCCCLLLAATAPRPGSSSH
jgi:hypothetical protein